MDTPSRQSTLEFDPSIHSIHPSNSQSFKPEARHDWPMPPSAFPTPARRRHLWLTITSVVTALVLIIASIVIVYARSSSEHPGPKTVTATSITQASTTATHIVKPSATANPSHPPTPSPSPTHPPTPSPVIPNLSVSPYSLNTSNCSLGGNNTYSCHVTLGEEQSAQSTGASATIMA